VLLEGCWKWCLEPYPGGCPGGCPEAVWGYTLEPDVSRVWGIRHFRGYPPEVRNSCVREYPKVRYPVHVPGKPGTRPSGSAPDACPGAVRDAVRDVSGRGFGSVLGTSWKCLPERPEVPSGASGSAFRTPKRLRKAENGRLGRFGLYPGRSTIDD
jgi:hypothetical protein